MWEGFSFLSLFWRDHLHACNRATGLAHKLSFNTANKLQGPNGFLVLLFWPGTGHRVWIYASIFYTREYAVSIYVALVQAIPCFDKKGNCHLEAAWQWRHSVHCQSVILQYLSIKGQQNHCTTHKLLYSHIYCANEELFCPVFLPRSLAML